MQAGERTWGEVRLEECPVDESNRIGPEGGGAAIFRSSMSWERACLSAQYLGVMDRQLDEVMAFAKERRQFGKALGRHQAIAHRVADMKLRLDAARLLLHRACWMKSEGLECGPEVSLAKLAISEAGVGSGLDTIQIFGALGIKTETGVATALLAHPEVEEAAMAAVGSGIDARLVAFVVARRELPLLEVKRHCAERLARHMMVDRAILLEQLPRPRNGKVDRLTL
jgi:alkylation response protein AidB-like acyl-CoA dehydrogenase